MAKLYTLGLAALAMAGNACMVESEDAAEDTGVVQQPIALTNTSYFSWNKGESPEILEPVNTHMCFLTKVSGDFDGWDEWVKIDKKEVNGKQYWRLHGNSSTSHTIRATAGCRKLDSGTKVSKQFSWRKGEGSKTLMNDLVPYDSQDSCFLVRVRGHFNGGGERVSLSQLPFVGWWKLGGESGASGDLGASARCIENEDLIARNSWHQDAVQDQFWLYPELANPLPPPLPHTTTVSCFLQAMQGKFQGGGETIETYYDQGLGVFVVGGGSGQLGVGATAGCIQ